MKEKDKSRPFIDINLSDQLVFYRKYIELINNIAYDSESFRVLPVLNRNLLENILRDIFSSSLKGEYNYLYFNPDRGRIRNFSTLLNVFNKLRKSYGESYAINIPDDLIDYLDKFRKDGNFSSHEIETHLDSNYVNEIKEKFSATLRVLFRLYQKIINSGKKIENIDDKLLSGKFEDKKLKGIDTSKIVSLIALIRNDIVNIKHDEIKDQTSISPNDKEQIQEKINELYVGITKFNLNIESSIDLIRQIAKLELELHSKSPKQTSMKNDIEFISVLFKRALLALNESDVLIVKQAVKIKNQKGIIIFMSICYFFLFFLLILRDILQN